MTNYVTKNQVFKGAWAVFLVVVTVAGWSFKVYADHSTYIGQLQTSMETEIEYRKAHEIILNDHTTAISAMQLQQAERDGDNRYMMQMMEMLLQKENLPLPVRD